MNPYILPAKIGAVILLLLAVWANGYKHGAAHVQAEFNKHLLADKAAEANAERAARSMEQAQAAEVARLMDENAKQRAANEATQKRIVDELLTARRQLRARWTCGVPATPGRAQEPDGATRDRAESAGRIVRAADDADSQIRALQDFIRAERK
jgi:hypothetical protein